MALLRYAFLFTRPIGTLICFVPDDAFYELQLARHFVATGIWSFDSGFTSTTGFHLFNVYLMSLFPWVLADPLLALRVWMGVGIALSIASIFIICHFTERRFGALALLPVFLVLTSRFFQISCSSILEFPFVIVLAAAYTTAGFSSRSEKSPGALVRIFLLGMLGSLVRSDFGGLPLAFVIACAARFLWNRRHDFMAASLVGLCGAVAGLFLVSMHNFFLSGHLLSDSARVKALAGHRSGYSVMNSLLLTVLTVASSKVEFFLIFAIVGVGVLALVVASALRERQGTSAQIAEPSGGDNYFLAGAGACAIVIYVLVYGFVPSIQPWYTANFVIPIVLVLSACTQWSESRPMLRAAIVGAFVLALVPHLRNSYKPVWPHQRHMYEMSQYLAEHPPNGRMAGWNVGIVGYFLDGKVTNLDGLMNDQIYADIRDRTVEEYLDRSRIKYLVDFPRQINSADLGNMGGYDSLRIGRRVTALETKTSWRRDGEWLDYTLFRFR